MYRAYFFNIKAIFNNITLIFILIGDIFYPRYFKPILIKYQKKSIEYVNYSILMSFSDMIYNDYNIDVIDITEKIKNRKIEKIENDDNISISSIISDTNSIESIENIDEELKNT